MRTQAKLQGGGERRFAWTALGFVCIAPAALSPGLSKSLCLDGKIATPRVSLAQLLHLMTHLLHVPRQNQELVMSSQSHSRVLAEQGRQNRRHPVCLARLQCAHRRQGLEGAGSLELEADRPGLTASGLQQAQAKQCRNLHTFY